MKELMGLPLEFRRRAHRCVLVQNAIKGNIPELFDNFKSTLNSNGYNTRNGHLLRFGRIRTELGQRIISHQVTNEWLALPPELKKPMPPLIFKRHLNNYFLKLPYKP